MNKSQHAKALEVLKNDGGYLSPMGIIKLGKLHITDSTMSRRCREDREFGILKSRRIESAHGRMFTVYAYKKSGRRK